MIEFVGRDGNRLAADAAGDPGDPPAVLLHGGGQTRHSWGRSGRGEDSRAFMSLNRNKRSVALDLKTESGGAEFRELVAVSVMREL